MAPVAPVKRQMHLGVFWLGAGNHSAGWRYEGAWSSNSSWPLVAAGAQIAERGKFDLFFISDSLVMDPGDHPAFVSRFEPTTLIAALAAVTRHVGLGATVSTSFSEPFDVARTFMTLHNISGGRAAWNIVTSSHNAAAANFSKERLPEHDLRYEIAGEFVDVVRGPLGHLGRRRHRRRPVDRRLPRQIQGARSSITRDDFSRSKGRSTSRPDAPRPSAPHPGRRLGARTRAVGAHRRSGVLGGQR